MKTVNLHTHSPLNENQLGLMNHQVQFEFSPLPDQFYSIGLHPWDITTETINTMLSKVADLASHKQVLSIGECGLDRSIEADIKLQKKVFLAQTEIAERVKKPIIIHAVRSYSDLLQLKKETKTTIPWILHGYKGNSETTKQLVNAGFYFSIGASIINNEEKQNQYLKAIPPSRLFFETDESTVNIESIYIFAASVLGVSINDLKNIVFNNYQQIFKR